MKTDYHRLVVTLPLYKDTSFLANAVQSLEKATSEISRNFVLLIAEDGSNSRLIVNSLIEKYPNIVHLQNDERLGRGRALREAWKKIQGSVYVYIDVDLATDLMKLDAYRNLVQKQGDFDLVTGSRYVRQSVTNRPRLRRFASRTYNLLIRILFQTGVHDHQCGFKSFSRRLVEVLSERAKSDSWFWDTEVIVLAKKMGFRVLEIPVCWTEKKSSRTPLTRLIKDIWLHGAGIAGLLYRRYRG